MENAKKFGVDMPKGVLIAGQEEGVLPKMDYSHYQTKELAMSIAKNAGAASLHSGLPRQHGYLSWDLYLEL